MLLVGWSQKANSMQVLVGIFLHVVRAPIVVVHFLSKIGLSVSARAINNAIDNLAWESVARVQEVGSDLAVALAFDNLDVMLRRALPTADGRWEELSHLCTATLIPVYLPPGVAWDDLRCATRIWTALGYSKLKQKQEKEDTHIPILKLSQAVEKMYPEPPADTHRLSRWQQFVAWLYMTALILHGPEWFH
jgi:hypothetical protein